MWIRIFDKVMESPIHQFLGEFFGNISSGKNETHCHSSAGQNGGKNFTYSQSCKGALPERNVVCPNNVSLAVPPELEPNKFL